MTEPPPETPGRVSTIELFFDLVFVFVITQVTLLVEHGHGAADSLRTLLVLVPIWWMHSAYTWLTNAAGTDRSMRLVLIAAMAGFLVMAIAAPEVHGPGALAFGLSYLFVVVLHLGAFRFWGGPAAAAAILRIAPFNLGAAALLIGASFVGEEVAWILLMAAALLFVAATIVRRERGFTLNAGHFAERHGLVVLIVLGESIIAIALGAGGEEGDVDGPTLIGLALSLLLVASLWWTYFDRDDRRAERSLVAASPEARSRMGLLGYWYGHLALIFGIVLIAAGIKLLLEHGEASGSAETWLLFGGMAVYMLGDVFFRWIMGMRPLAVRLSGAAIAILFGFIGPLWGAQPALAMAAALVIAVIAIEWRMETRGVSGREATGVQAEGSDDPIATQPRRAGRRRRDS